MSSISSFVVDVGNPRIEVDGRQLHRLTRREYELYCQLVVALVEDPHRDGGRVTVDEVWSLPRWRGNKDIVSVGKQVSRYIGNRRRQGHPAIIRAESTKGPYSLDVPFDAIAFRTGTVADLKRSLGPMGHLEVPPDQLAGVVPFARKLWRADIAFEDGDLELAKLTYQAALDSAELPHLRFIARHCIARVLFQERNFAELLASADAIASAAATAGLYRILEEATAYSIRAYAYREQGDNDQAILEFSRALNRATGTAHYRLLTDLHNGLGDALLIAKRFEEARLEYLKALRFAVSGKNWFGIYIAHAGTGLALLAQAEQMRRGVAAVRAGAGQYYREAATWFEEAVEIRRRAKVGHEESHTLATLAILYVRLGRIDQAERLIREAHAQADPPDFKKFSYAWACRARLELIVAKEHWAEARSLISKCEQEIAGELTQDWLPELKERVASQGN